MLNLHLRNLPHFFDPAKLPPSQAMRPFLICLFSGEDWAAEWERLLLLARQGGEGLPRVWKILVSDLSPKATEGLQAQLESHRLPEGHPLLELEILAPRHWPALFGQSQGCLSLSANPDHALRQIVQALAMELPVLAFTAPAPPYQALPIHPWPASEEAISDALKRLLAVPQPPLRAALLKSLELQETLSAQHLQATEVIALLFWGRSGSVFLQSLLDRHPEVLSTPTTILMRFYEIWPELLRSLVNTRRAFELGDLLDLFITTFPSLFDATHDSSNCRLDQLGPERNQVLKVDPADFKEAFLWLAQSFFRGSLEITSRTFFLLLHYAYECAQGLDISAKRLIAYQLHRPSLNPSTSGLFRDFPQARVLGMVREPLRGFHSHLRMYLEDTRCGQYAPPRPDYSYEEMVCDGTYLGYYQHQLGGWKALQREYHPPLYEMQLEALHQNPEKEMQKLAQWLGIAWHPCLLQSTFNGLEYWGDSRAHKPIQGFSSQHPHSQAWEAQFSWLDREVLYALLAEDLERQGYGSPFPFVRQLLPLLIFWPTLLERQAFEKALRARDSKTCEDLFLNLLDRWKISFMALFGRTV